MLSVCCVCIVCGWPAGTEANIVETSGGLGQFLLVVNVIFIVAGVACACVLALDAASFLQNYLPSFCLNKKNKNGMLQRLSSRYSSADRFS